MNSWIHFGHELNLSFIFPDRRTLKFVKVQYNATPFYLLDYVTHQPEKKLKKKNGSKTNWPGISKYRHTFVPLKNVMLLVYQILTSNMNCYLL